MSPPGTLSNGVYGSQEVVKFQPLYCLCRKLKAKYMVFKRKNAINIKIAYHKSFIYIASVHRQRTSYTRLILTSRRAALGKVLSPGCGGS